MIGLKKRRAGRWANFEAEAMPHLVDLTRVALWLLRDRAEAEDLVQETFMRALQSFHRYEAGTNIRAWLMTIMYRTRNKNRRAAGLFAGGMEERIAETVAFEPPVAPNLTDGEVLAALERLPAQFREAVVLSDVEEFSYKEIAKVLQIPVGTVMSRINRGRKLLRAELAVTANAYGIGRQSGAAERISSLG